MVMRVLEQCVSHVLCCSLSNLWSLHFQICQRAKEFEALVLTDDRFELFVPCSLGLVCFRLKVKFEMIILVFLALVVFRAQIESTCSCTRQFTMIAEFTWCPEWSTKRSSFGWPSRPQKPPPQTSDIAGLWFANSLTSPTRSCCRWLLSKQAARLGSCASWTAFIGVFTGNLWTAGTAS